MAGNAFVDLLRSVGLFICTSIYKLIPLLYKLIIYLANVNMSTGNTLNSLINRLYSIVGIFMLFKLSFSIIRYIVDPDSFNDHSKGFVGLVKRVIIAFVLIVLVPWFFKELYVVQGTILSENIIPNMILGTNESSEADNLESAAKDIQFLLFGSFYSINYRAAEFSDCEPSSNYPLTNIIGSRDMVKANDGRCFKIFSEAIEKNEDLSSYGVILEDFFKTADSADIAKHDVNDVRNFEAFGALVNWKDYNGEYAIDFNWIASLLSGGYLVFLLLSFCIDIGGRAIRLMFMQVLSPVAILSSVDPASSSQSDKLKDWVKECLQVYASLFTRLAVVYFVVQLIKMITESVLSSSNDLYYGNMESSGSMNVLVYIFLILGAFQVAKKLPELLEKALGVKFSGDINLNPFKALTENTGLSLATGLGVGAVAGGMAGLTAGSEAGAPVRGLLGGAATGAMKGFESKPKFGMMGDIRRKTYKDMTGNDFRSFNPLAKIYGFGGDKKISRFKEGYLNRAFEQKNTLQTRLNAVQHSNAERYSRLTRSGINPITGEGVTQARDRASNLNGRISEMSSALDLRRSALAKLRSSRDNKTAGVKALDQQIAALEAKKQGKPGQLSFLSISEQKQLDSLKAQRDSEQKVIEAYEKAISKVGDNISTREQEIRQVSAERDASQSLVDLYDQYAEGVKEENELRSELTSVDKNISTLQDQKSQMERFYQIDSSPKESVESAKKSIEDRERKI